MTSYSYDIFVMLIRVASGASHFHIERYYTLKFNVPVQKKRELRETSPSKSILTKLDDRLPKAAILLARFRALLDTKVLLIGKEHPIQTLTQTAENRKRGVLRVI
jgi:hypothetical protein